MSEETPMPPPNTESSSSALVDVNTTRVPNELNELTASDDFYRKQMPCSTFVALQLSK